MFKRVGALQSISVIFLKQSTMSCIRFLINISEIRPSEICHTVLSRQKHCNLGIGIPNTVVAHSITSPQGLIIPKLRLVKNDPAMLSQHFQATISPRQNKPTLLPEETLLLLWQLHTCLFFLCLAKSPPQSNPLYSCTNAYNSTNTPRDW